MDDGVCARVLGEGFDHAGDCVPHDYLGPPRGAPPSGLEPPRLVEPRLAPVTRISPSFSSPFSTCTIWVVVWSVIPVRICTGSIFLSGSIFQTTATSLGRGASFRGC